MQYILKQTTFEAFQWQNTVDINNCPSWLLDRLLSGAASVSQDTRSPSVRTLIAGLKYQAGDWIVLNTDDSLDKFSEEEFAAKFTAVS